MLTYGLQSTTIHLTQLSLTSTSISSTRIQGSAEGELSSLISAIKSGDTADAQNCLADLKMVSTANADPSSPLGAFLATVTNALGSYNIAGAQSALATLESTTGPRIAPVESTAALSLMPSKRSSQGVSAMGQDLLSLSKAIDSGDTASAQSAYGSLSSLLEGSGASDSNYGDLLGNSSESGSLYSLMTQIGSALSTGNLTCVQGTMDKFMQNLSSGSLVSTTA